MTWGRAVTLLWRGGRIARKRVMPLWENFCMVCNRELNMTFSRLRQTHCLATQRTAHDLTAGQHAHHTPTHLLGGHTTDHTHTGLKRATAASHGRVACPPHGIEHPHHTCQVVAALRTSFAASARMATRMHFSGLRTAAKRPWPPPRRRRRRRSHQSPVGG